MKPDPKDLVAHTRRVRVRSGAVGSEHVFVEGKVVAYSQHPQICVQADDGTQSWWPVTLPIDVVQPLPPEPPVGSVVLRRLKGNTNGTVYRRYPNGWFQPGGEGEEDDARTWVELHDDAEVVLLVPVAEPPYLPWRVTSQAGNEITVTRPNSHGEVPLDVAHPTTRVLLSPAAARGLAAALNAAADEADR